MGFPDSCLRGISDRAWVTPDGRVGSGLFQFSRPAGADGWLRESINWDDDGGALQSLLDQCKENGERQSRGGAAVIPRAEIDRLKSLPMVNGVFPYERNALATNPYHGNILLRADLHAHTKRRMAAGLALLVSAVVGGPAVRGG